MTQVEEWQVMDTEAQVDFSVANAPDCPNCGRASDTHVVTQGNDALCGDGIYCGVCETFIAALPDITV